MSVPASRRVLAFLIALLLTVVWGALVQTQFNLAELVALGVPIPPGLRAQTSLDDLLGFGPTFAVMALPALLLAFVVAALLSRRVPRWREPLFAIGGLVGLMLAIRLVDALVPPPVLIAATRSLIGLLAVSAGALLGGALYGRLTRPA